LRFFFAIGYLLLFSTFVLPHVGGVLHCCVAVSHGAGITLLGGRCRD
jgi:hypothetical protein